MNVNVQTMPAQAMPDAVARRMRWGFAEWFIVSQTALPAILILPGTQAFRLPIRVSAFLLPLGAFIWWNLNSEINTRTSKVQSWVFAVMFLLAVMLFHPETPSFMGGLAHMAVYFAVMAPLFWAPAFVRTPEQLARILWILLVCSGINAVVGVLQVYDPARWLPAEFSHVLLVPGTIGLDALTYVGPGGRQIIRPPGLFDTPGSVAGPAAYAALLGLVFAVSAIPMWKRVLSLIFAGAGLAAIYLSQVRISLVCTLAMLALYAVVQMKQGKVARASQFTMLAAGIVVGGFMLALALGGQTVSDRFMTLLASDPLTVYNGARGAQMQLTFNDLLVNHPFGSGLGRWGMAAGYFGTFSAGHEALWAEIQFTGWMIDGGLLMVALYGGALIVAAMAEYQVAMIKNVPRLAQCGAVVLAANAGCALLVFSFTPFVAQVGIQYWFLVGALHGVTQSYGLDGA